MKVYVVILYDRHVDDTIEVYRNIDDANTRINRYILEYARDGYEWKEEDWGQPVLVRDVHTFDDGPSARIEVTELK